MRRNILNLEAALSDLKSFEHFSLGLMDRFKYMETPQYQNFKKHWCLCRSAQPLGQIKVLFLAVRVERGGIIKGRH